MLGDSRFYCSFFMAVVVLIQFGSLESYRSRLIYHSGLMLIIFNLLAVSSRMIFRIDLSDILVPDTACSLTD